jgi:hypothetical protein
MQLCLSPKELSGFVAHLFDKGVPTARPSSVLTPFSSDNPPHLVRILDFFTFISDPCSYESVLFIHQDLYPARLIDAMQRCPIVAMAGRMIPRAMTMEAMEHLPFSRLLLIRLGPAQQCKSALLPSISLQPLLLWAAVPRRRNTLCLLPSANNLRPSIRWQLYSSRIMHLVALPV